MGPQAQVTSIQPTDAQALQMRNAYTGVMMANQEALAKAHDTTLMQMFAAFAASLGNLVSAADRLPVVLGRPSYTVLTERSMGHAPGGVGADSYDGGSINTRQQVNRDPVKATPFMLQALANADARRTQTITQGQQLQAEVIAAALASVAPALPNHAERASVGYVRGDLEKLLETAAPAQRQSIAAGLVSDAVASSDRVTLAVLLGNSPESLELVARRLPGLDITRLRRQYIDLTVAANPSGLNGGSGMYSGGVPGVAAFIQLQDDPNRSLDAAGAAAVAYFDFQRANVAALVTR